MNSLSGSKLLANVPKYIEPTQGMRPHNEAGNPSFDALERIEYLGFISEMLYRQP